MAKTNIPTTVTLNNGQHLPLVGLGTLKSNDDELRTAIRCAIECGYRHIDTAHKYGNEQVVGEAVRQAIRDGVVTREEMFITTKLARARMGEESVAPNLQQSLDRLQLDYVDLYLVHSPFGYKNVEGGSLLPRDKSGKLQYEHYDAAKTWREMEKLVDSGKVKSIGVSNFNSVQLDYVCKNARILPVTNQVEVHAYLPQYALNEFCRSRGITLTAYAPLGAPRRADVYQRENDPVLLEEEIVLKVANKYGKTPAQILLRDIVQRGIPVLPKSSTPSRIKENFEIFDFELAQEDVVAIAELNKKKRRFYDMLWMAEGHPDYPFTVAY